MNLKEKSAHTTQNCNANEKTNTSEKPLHAKEMESCNTCIQNSVGLAQAMVANQPYETPLSPEQGLICGTAFSSLSMPYSQGFWIWLNEKGE